MKLDGNDGNDLPREILEAALELWSQSDSEHILPITGTSMLPLLQEGDQVLVQSGARGARRGDILVFRQVDQLISHRLLAMVKNEEGDLLYLTKGDNQMHPDAWIKQGEVLGVVLLVKKGERLLHFDTRLWSAFNRFIAWMMYLQVNLSQRYRNSRFSPDGESSRNQFSIFAKVLHKVNRFILRMMQGFYNREKSK